MKPNAPRKRRVAIIDDEAVLTEMHEHLLSPFYDVLTFNHPREFLKHLNFHIDSPFDAVISDYKMPELNGLEMILEARKMGYAFPFLLYSGYLDKQTVMNAVNAGAFRLLEKPSTGDMILKSLGEVLAEGHYRALRKEIRDSIDKLREYYSGISALLSRYVSKQELEALFVETNIKGKITKIVDGETLLNNLENRLDELLAEEETLEETRLKKSA